MAAESTERKWEPGMGEISGFGGGYEDACRRMLFAGLAWLDAHPEADPKFREYKGITDLIGEDNDDAKALSAAVTAPVPDCSGAMHQATVSHCLWIRAKGWPAYVEKMKERGKRDAAE